MAAKLKTGPLQSRVFYLESAESRSTPALGGISASASASDLSVGASYAEVVPGNQPNTSSEGAYGLLGASYKFARLLPWSPTLSYGYTFVSGTPDALVDDGAHPVYASSALVNYADSSPLQYLSGNSIAQIGLSVQPAQTSEAWQLTPTKLGMAACKQSTYPPSGSPTPVFPWACRAALRKPTRNSWGPTPPVTKLGSPER